MLIQPLTPPMTTLVFVYGTLKRGFFNHHILASSNYNEGAVSFASLARTVECFPLFLDYYRIPYLVDRPGVGGRISGELWQVDDPTLAALDELEGVAKGRYSRMKIDVVVMTEDEDKQRRDDDNATREQVIKTAWFWALGDMREGTNIESRALVSDYSMNLHEGFIPPGPDRDTSLWREWGGYELE